MSGILARVYWRVRSEIARREAEIAAAETRQRVVLLGAERRGLVIALDILEHEHVRACRKKGGTPMKPEHAPLRRNRAATVSTLCAVLGLLGVSGCATLSKPASVTDLGGGVTWMQYDATRRGAVILPAGERRIICAEPSPDVAVEATAKLLLQVQYAGATGSLSPELAARVVELAGRTQTVLVLRETLFRACEQSAAGNLTGVDIRAVYTDALATVRAMTEADRARSVEGAAKALDLLDTETRAMLDRLSDPNGTTP